MDRVFIAFIIGLSSSIGALTGFTTHAWMEQYRVPMFLTEEPGTGSLIPTITLEGIRNGELNGRVAGSARIFAGDTPVAITQSGAFSIADRAILTNEIVLIAPPGMKFVASAKGKKYYPLHAASAKTIIPANRIYFKTAKEAEASGYRP